MVTGIKIQYRYKQTEVGLIPEDWEVHNILDNSILKARIGWQGLTTAEYLKQGEYFLVTGTDFLNGEIQWSNCHFVEEKRYSQDKNIQLKKGDNLVTKDGTIGKVAHIRNLPGPATLNSGVFVIRPKDDSYKPLFFFYILSSNYFSSFLKQLKAGSTISHLYQKDFINFNFVVPPTRTEQTAIATVLYDTDMLIEHLKKLITKKKAIKQGTMQQLLTGKKRLPGFNGNWEVKELRDVVDFINGKAHENFISEMGDYVVANSKFISTEGKTFKYSNICFCPAPAGSILMVMSDVPNGKAIAKCFFVNRDNKYTVNQRICALKPKINAKFLFYKINRNPYYLAFDDGVKQTNLRKEDVLGCKLNIPKEVPEQAAIATILSDMDVDIERLEQRRDKYKMLKQGMMQQLLTGKIRLL